jgi:hypothetical protein
MAELLLSVAALPVLSKQAFLTSFEEGLAAQSNGKSEPLSS